jgi:cytidylate kinase
MKFKFDKFVKDLEKREAANQEEKAQKLHEREELPQRVYNRLYREKWQNSIRFNWRKK